MSTRFERKCERIDTKKAMIVKEYMNKFCKNKASLKTSAMKKELKKFAKQMVKLEKRKYGIHNHVSIKETKNNRIYGSLSYGKGPGLYRDSNKNVKVRFGTVMNLNYSTVVAKLKSNDISDRTDGFIKYMETIHHESGHLEQHVATEGSKKVKDISPEYALKYALEFVSISAQRENYYKKGDNYYNMLIEKNAREKGITNTFNVLGKSNKKNIVKKGVLKRLDGMLQDEFVELQDLESDDGREDRFSYTNEIADEAIKKNPNYIKRMPILNKIYTKDGNRKPIYQIVRENAMETRKIQYNPFIPRKVKDKRIQEVQNVYSEAFAAKLDTCTQEEFEFAGKMLGKKPLQRMIKITAKHYERKYNEFAKSAEDEREIRENITGMTRLGRTMYRERLEDNEGRYAPYIETLQQASEFTQNMNTRKMSESEIRRQLKIDNLNVKNNIKKNKLKGNSKNIKLNENASFEHEVTESDLKVSVDLEEMRSLKEEYSENKKYNMAKLEQVQDEYHDIEEKNIDKNKDFYNR